MKWQNISTMWYVHTSYFTQLCGKQYNQRDKSSIFDRVQHTTCIICGQFPKNSTTARMLLQTFHLPHDILSILYVHNLIIITFPTIYETISSVQPAVASKQQINAIQYVWKVFQFHLSSPSTRYRGWCLFVQHPSPFYTNGPNTYTVLHLQFNRMIRSPPILLVLASVNVCISFLQHWGQMCASIGVLMMMAAVIQKDNIYLSTRKHLSTSHRHTPRARSYNPHGGCCK